MGTGISTTGKAGMRGLAIALAACMLMLTLTWLFAHRLAGDDARALHEQGHRLQYIVLPVSLTWVALLAWWGARRLRAMATKPLSTPVHQAAPHALPSAQQQAPAVLPAHAPAIVLAEAVSLPAGQDADAWQSLKEGRFRPGLDPELFDLDGLPVFSARVPELNLPEWAHARSELHMPNGQPLPEQVLRALALLEGPLSRLMDALLAWQHGPEPGQADVIEGVTASSLLADAPRHLSGVGLPGQQARRQALAAQAPRLMVRLCLPAAWPDEARAVALRWLRSQCSALLDWAEHNGAQTPIWLTDPLAPEASSEAIWAELASLWQQWTESARPQLMLLLAADSAVDAEHILAWQARGDLFTSHHQRGRVPGEAASGLLLANMAWRDWVARSKPASQVALPDAPWSRHHAFAEGLQEAIDACPRMWCPEQLRRERSADVVGRVNSHVVQQLMHKVAARMVVLLPGGGCPDAAPEGAADDVIGPSAEQRALSDPHEWLLVSDGDHRPSRTCEVFEALQAVRPQADPMSSVVRAGDACGDMGLARALVPVALASLALRHGETSGLAMALQVQDSLQRVVVPLTPSAWPPRGGA